MSRSIKTPALAAITGSLMLAGSAFASTPLVQGYMLTADAAAEGRKTDAKAPAAKGATSGKAAEGKCGEGACGAGMRKPATKPAAAQPAAAARKVDAKSMAGKCGGAL